MERLSSRVQEVETLKMQILAETPNNATLDTDAAKKFAGQYMRGSVVKVHCLAVRIFFFQCY